MFVPCSSLQNPRSAAAKNGAINIAAPSTIAASTTWPAPVAARETSAQTMPKARSSPPPPKSPTTFNGGVGGWPARPNACSAPASAM
jgi:hypothetical protein